MQAFLTAAELGLQDAHGLQFAHTKEHMLRMLGCLTVPRLFAESSRAVSQIPFAYSHNVGVHRTRVVLYWYATS